MAFWGIEVKPGKSYTHCHDESHGRLHISQATLGNGKGTTKSVLLCNVGGRSPVLLCSLFPDRSESCHLDLEFEEDDDVVFSVLGSRSVHLTGFFVGSRRRGCNYDDEIEPYGEDIGEDSSDSYDSEEDDYESDFIDDSSMEIFPSSPPKSSVVIEEIIEDDKQINGNANHQRLKKKYQFSDTDDDKSDSHQVTVKPNSPTELESEDEDGFPISSNLESKSTVEGNIRPTAKIVVEDRKRKVNCVGEHAETARELCQLGDSSLPLVDNGEDCGMQRKRKKVKEGKSFVDLAKASTNKIGSEPNQDLKDKSLQSMPKEIFFAPGVEVSLSGHVQEQKKENKDDTKRIGISENLSSEKEEAVKSDPNSVSKTDGPNQENPSEAEKLPDSRVDSNGKSRKSKKKNRNKVIKDGNNQDVCSTAEISVKDMQEGKHPKSEDMRIADANLQKASEDNSMIDEDLATTKNNVCNDKAQKETKKKKKSNKDLAKDMNADHKSLNLFAAEQNVEPRKARNFSNGLTVEELSMGKPDGKKASPGSKVSINYIGKLQNGMVFESNIGERPLQFLLGIGQAIKGWDIGIKGMRVGDKRRLKIPPSMGYQENNGEDKPVYSWLVYDVELVDVQ